MAVEGPDLPDGNKNDLAYDSPDTVGQVTPLGIFIVAE